jgi:hypothetical protein
MSRINSLAKIIQRRKINSFGQDGFAVKKAFKMHKTLWRRIFRKISKSSRGEGLLFITLSFFFCFGGVVLVGGLGVAGVADGHVVDLGKIFG